MKIDTKSFGEITIDESEIIQFPEGLLGFDTINRFILLEEKNSPMMWLQACDEPELAFVLIKVHDFMNDYRLHISQADLDALKCDSVDALVTYAILTIPSDDPSRMTANLMGPVVINHAEKLGRQAISLSSKYKTKHSVLDELNRKKEE